MIIVDAFKKTKMPDFGILIFIVGVIIDRHNSANSSVAFKSNPGLDLCSFIKRMLLYIQNIFNRHF